jgi:hypothetical protein
MELLIIQTVQNTEFIFEMEFSHDNKVFSQEFSVKWNSIQTVVKVLFW